MSFQFMDECNTNQKRMRLNAEFKDRIENLALLGPRSRNQSSDYQNDMNLGSKPSLRARIGKARSKLHKSELSRLGGNRENQTKYAREQLLGLIWTIWAECVKLDGMRRNGSSGTTKAA